MLTASSIKKRFCIVSRTNYTELTTQVIFNWLVAILSFFINYDKNNRIKPFCVALCIKPSHV